MTYPYSSISSVNPQNIVVNNPLNIILNTRDPVAADNTYPLGTEWENTTSHQFFKCTATAFSGATWVPFAPANQGNVSTLTGNNNLVAVGPDGLGNINIVGDGTTVDVTGNSATNTLTITAMSGTGASSFVTNIPGPVVPTGGGAINVNASTSTYTDGSVANTLKTEVQGTDHSIFIGKGAAMPATTITAGTDGQVVVGATGADPAFATLTSAASTITYTLGPNTLNLDVTAPLDPSHGGTGLITIPAHDLLVGNGTSALGLIAPSGTSGIPLVSKGAAADPAFDTALIAGGGTGATSFNIDGVVITGATTTTPLSSLTLADGEIVIGATGATPMAASLTAGANIIITPGPNTITIAATGGAGSLSTLTGNSGGAVSPTAGNINVKGDGSVITVVGDPGTSTLTAAITGTVPVNHGGTGNTSFTPYAVVTGGVTSTSPLQQVAGLGSSGYVLTSNGAGMLPSFKAASSPGNYSFFAYLSATVNNVTGTGGFYTIPFDSTRFVNGGGYSTGTGVYTVPVSGIYLLTAAVTLVGITPSHTQYNILFITTPYNIKISSGNAATVANYPLGDMGVCGATTLNLTAGQQVYVSVEVANGALVVDVYGAANGGSSFSATLLG